MTLECIKFVAKAGKYNANDIASFRPHDAKRYIDAGKAIAWDPNPPAVTESAEKAPETAKEEKSKSDSSRTARAERRRVRAMEAEKSESYETKDE